MRAHLCGVVAITIGITAGFSAAHAAPAGSVIYAHGEVNVRDAAGNDRRATRGGPILAGETLVTGNGRTQMRMADGGFIQVQPNTQFRVEEYQYSGAEDGTERSFFELVKGGVRFITGTIGHKNKQNFRIKTTVATIGIRGSAGRADMCVAGSCGGRPDGLYVTGNQDTLTMRNETAEVDITPGQTFHTECSSCGIQQVEQAPDAYAAVVNGGKEEKEEEKEEASAEESSDEGTETADSEAESEEQGLEEVVALDDLSGTEFTAGDERTEDGALDATSSDASSSTSISKKPIGIAYHKEFSPSVKSAGVASWGDDGSTGNSFTLGGANNVPQFGSGTNVSGSDPGSDFSFNTASAVLAEQGSDSVAGVAWARWSSNWTASVNGTPVLPAASMHAIYATSLQTVNVPASGTATYSNIVGGTSPTLDSNLGSYVGTLSAMTLQVDFDTNQVTGAMAGTFSESSAFNASITGTLNGLDQTGGSLSLSGACTGGYVCASPISLFGGSEFGLVGPNANAAAGAYDLKDSSGNAASITGTYLLSQ